MGIKSDEKPPRKTPQDSGEERSIGIPPEQLGNNVSEKNIPLPPDAHGKIIPIEVEDRLEWTKEANWTQPKWLSNMDFGKSSKSYDQHYMTLLRSRYWRLEGDFRTFYNNYYNSGQIDFVVARRLIDTLLMSKKLLESADCDIVAARDLLGIAEQYMVSLYPKHIAKQRGQVLASRVMSYDAGLSQKIVETISDEKFDSGELTALMSSITDTLNQKDRDELIVNKLQVSKLDNLVRYGKWAVIFLLITLPFILNFDPSIWKGSVFEIEEKKLENKEIKRTVVAKPVQKVIKTEGGIDSTITEIETTVTDSPSINIEMPDIEENTANVSDEKPSLKGQHWKKWFINIAVAILGGVGAFFSGLLAIRRNRIQLADYQESMTNYILRIIVGMIASMVLFVFVSWNTIPGVIFTNAGSILFIAFLAGFSESFFLKQLGVDDDNDNMVSIQSGATAPAAVVGNQGQ